MGRSKEINTAIILLILHTSTAKPNKNTAPAVFEVINEQARIDDKRILPYANPLAGNSQQNAKLHAQHQQAMFNAERMRQQRAQLQRWNKQPTRQHVDSYMKAYQESQENHHLALEQMQSNIKEKKAKTRTERPLKDRPQIEPVKVTRADAMEKNRNHRSYGSVYTGVQKQHKVNTYPGPTYDQGVTIKPNGNVGLYNFEKERHTGLYTEAIPSKTQYVYPKLYSQMHTYQSANDINTLNTLLSKPPQEQLTQLNTLIHTVNEPSKDTLDTPIDLFFYLKDPHLAQVEPVPAAYGPYAAEYNTAVPYKDHTPITEEVDDVQDEKDNRVHAYPTPTVPTVLGQLNDDPTTTKSNYYKIEVEQTVSGNVPKNIEYTTQEKPSYEGLTYEKPLNFYISGPSTEGVKYLQSQSTGVQHLSQDGTGVSAYGDDDVSIANNRTKRDIDTQYFILGNETLITEKSVADNNLDPNLNETIVSLEINCTVTINNSNETIANVTEIDRNDTLPVAEELKRNRYIAFDNAHQVGEANEYDYAYDEDDNSNSKYDYSYDDYDSDYELNGPDYEYDSAKVRPRPIDRPNKQRKPNSKQNGDVDGSYSSRYSKFRHPNYYDFHSEPNNNYGPNQQYPPNSQYGPPTDSYGPPLQYGPSNQFGPPSNSYGQTIQYGPPAIQRPRPNIGSHYETRQPDVSTVIDSLEPVYMLTKSQIKELVGQPNLNIEHLDVFQVGHDPKPRRPRYPRQPKKKFRRRIPKKGRQNKIGKFRKFNKIVMY